MLFIRILLKFDKVSDRVFGDLGLLGLGEGGEAREQALRVAGEALRRGELLEVRLHERAVLEKPEKGKSLIFPEFYQNFTKT